MRLKNKIFRMLLQVIVLVMIGGVFTSNLIQSTFATNVDKSPNVIVKINGDGKIGRASCRERV